MAGQWSIMGFTASDIIAYLALLGGFAWSMIKGWFWVKQKVAIMDEERKTSEVMIRAIVDKNKNEIDLKILQMEKEFTAHRCDSDKRFDTMLERIDKSHLELMGAIKETNLIIQQTNQNVLNHIASHSK